MTTQSILKNVKKQVRRINRQIKRLESRGYRLKPAEEIVKLPANPNKQTLKRLERITTSELYNQAEYYDRQRGEWVSGTEGRKIERSEAARRGWAERKKRMQAENVERNAFDVVGLMFDNLFFEANSVKFPKLREYVVEIVLELKNQYQDTASLYEWFAEYGGYCLARLAAINEQPYENSFAWNCYEELALMVYGGVIQGDYNPEVEETWEE